MKIALYYNTPWEIGGVEKSMYNRAKALSKLGYEITFVFNSPKASIEMLEKWSEVGNVVRYDYCEDTFDYAIYDSIYNNKLVNANEYIQVMNGNVIDANDKYNTNIPFDKYVCVSEECKKQLNEKYNIDSYVIPNILNEDEIKKLAKEKCKLSDKKYNFVVVSRIDPVKGFDKLALFCNELEKHTKDYQITVVGSNNNFPQYEKEYKELLKEYNINWVGKQDNPYKYMANADYLVMLSKFESQCMVMYESLICGTPVITTDFPNAKRDITKELGYVLKQDLSNLNIKDILKNKHKVEYKYPDYSKDWVKVLKPIEKKDIKFSILVPNYNNGEYLEKCLDSLLNQTYKNYEIIFIDDVSTDNSVEIAKKKLKYHKVIELKQKRYNGGTRNVGILEATGDYIMCIDSDDWLTSNDILERLNKFIKNEDIIFTGFDILKDNRVIVKDTPKHPSLDEAFKHETCAIWTKVVKTSIFKKCLFSEGTLMEDKVHHYRLMEMCRTFKNFPYQTHCWNRGNSHSVSTERNPKWESSGYRHIADMMDYCAWTTNEEHKRYVLNKIGKMESQMKRGIYQQI